MGANEISGNIQCNTFNLRNKGWMGVIVDADQSWENSLKTI